MLAVQSLGQLQNRYPNNLWSEIVGNCDIQLMLGCTDDVSAEYFSARSGDMSIEVNSTMTVRRTTELQVMEPEKLEVQLGVDWAGTEFQLKTDAGLYPGTITVDQDGVLRLEIGGSKSYVLSCMNSSVSTPVPQSEQASATNSEKTESETEQDESNTIAGIPVVHLILFGGGMLIAVGGLIGLYFVKKRQEAAESQQDYDDEDDE